MTGYITPGEIGNTLAESAGTDLIPSGAGEVMGAAFGQEFSRTTPALFGWLNARTPSRQPRTLPPDQANEMFGIEGHLRFNEPVTMDIARDRYDHERARLVREDSIRRASGDFGTGAIARFAAGAAGTLLDPLNVASAFVPFVGEANIARAFGVTGASALGRAGVRATQGAGAGAIGAAVVEPVNLWLAREYEDDYTMGDAMMSLAMGAVVGSFLHTGLGIFRDARRGIPDWTPQAHQAAVQQSVAALAEGRPVMAAETIEFTAAREARQELESWYSKIRQVDERARAAETTARTRTEAMTAAADELAMLRQEAAQLGREMRAVETLRATRSLDLPQRTRLAEIDAKLGDESTPLSERLTMELERLDLLDEAAGRGRPREARALDAERDDAQMEGLSRAAGRLRSKAALAEAKLRRTQERLLQADAELRRARGLQATREATVLALADKTVRRLAFRLGIALEPGQSLELASQFIRTAGGDIEAALMRLRTDLGEAGRAGGVDIDGLRIEPDIDIVQNALRGLSEREARAATALREGLRLADDAADVRAARLTAAEIENAPRVEGTMADEIAEAQAAVKEIEDVLAAEERQAAAVAKAEGREPPKPSREMEAIAEEAKDAERMAKAYEAAAVCAIGRA